MRSINPFSEKKPMVLVVEDEPINQTVVSLFLEEAGYAFDIVSSGEEALKQLISRRYAAVLMDLDLPGISGLETTQHIRHLGQIPIIALTAREQSEAMPQCLAVGMNDFLNKPFDNDVLKARLNEWVIKG